MPHASRRRRIIRVLGGLFLRPRQIAPVALFLALTVAGFVVARVLAERGVRHDAEQRAEVAAAQIRGRVVQAASLTESLRRFMLDASGTGVTSDEFARNALRWLSPARSPAAAWVEQVPDSRRASYERRIGQPIVTPDERHRVVPYGSRATYLPATLVSGFAPMAVPGTDLGGAPGMAEVLARATRLNEVAATPKAPTGTGTNGIFLVAAAPNLVGEVLRPGHVAVFVSDLRLRAAATDAPTVRIRAAGTSTEPREGAKSASETFRAAGQRYDVVVPRESVEGAAAVLPWIILAGGLVVAALGGALGLNAARRAKAQDELDRIFTLSSDLITVANFDGYFTRVNPAAERVFGYTKEEFLARPYLDFVHPDDRERTTAEAAAIGEGRATHSFENRFAHKDGSYRVLEWTATPVPEDGVMYGVARDVTERHQAEAEVERLAAEQAALHRVATLVAEGAAPAAVFDAVAGEMAALLDADQVALNRFEPGDEILVLAHRGLDVVRTPVGSRLSFAGESVTAMVRRTGRPARMENYDGAQGALAELARTTGLRSSVSAPIVVEGRLWGLITASWKGEQSPHAETEQRMSQFAQLLDTAIANAEARAELMASRVRLVTASDEARRRFERDLHDGVQQRLVSLSLELRSAEAMVPARSEKLAEQLAHVVKGVAESLDDLRELSRGIHPAVLSEGGLVPALKTLTRRSAVPVKLELAMAERLAEHVEIGAYYVVSEALTNAAKHARASKVEIHARALDGMLELTIDDDGVGGADPSRGSGLTGLADRVEALGGRIWITSPPGGGTSLRVELSLDPEQR